MQASLARALVDDRVEVLVATIVVRAIWVRLGSLVPAASFRTLSGALLRPASKIVPVDEVLALVQRALDLAQREFARRAVR